MTSRIPEPPSEMEAEGIPDPGTATAGEPSTGQDEGVMTPPRDTATAVDDFGTTSAEQASGEDLDGRLEREVPDVLDAVDQPADESAGADTPFSEAAGQGIGRIVEPDQGGAADTEKDMIAADVGTDLGGYSAEESAMHLEPEA